jgi:hypothetical protein
VTAAPLAAAAGLIALVPGGLTHVSAPTLERVGRVVAAPSTSLGLAWARRGSTLALVAKPVATGQPIRIVDARTLRTRRVIGVGDRDVCGLTYDRGALVALVANQPCYWPNGRFAVVRYGRGGARTIRVAGLRTVFPTNLAFGDGHAFVARAGGGIESIDLHTGRLVRHRPRRALAKGEGIVSTRWLGSHRLALGGSIVDVRSWRARPADGGAVGVARTAGGLAAYGAHGIAILTGTGRIRYRVLADANVRVVRSAGRYLYAASDFTAWIVDLRTHRVAAASIDPGLVWSLLVPS